MEIVKGDYVYRERPFYYKPNGKLIHIAKVISSSNGYLETKTSFSRTHSKIEECRKITLLEVIKWKWKSIS